VIARWPRWLCSSLLIAAAGLFPFGGAPSASAGNVADTGSERGADASEELTPTDERPARDADGDAEAPAPRREARPARPRGRPRARPATGLWALAHPRFHRRHLDADLFARPNRRSGVVGLVRRGRRIAVGRRVRGGYGCRHGHWYQAAGGGYLCTSWGFAVGRAPRAPYRQPAARVDRARPYAYYKSLRRRAPMLRRLPTGAEARRIAKAVAGVSSWPAVVLRRMAGAYFLAKAREITHRGKRYLQTIRGEYVRREDLEPFGRSKLRGQVLDAKHRLPLAFVLPPQAKVYGARQGELTVTGKLTRYDRVRVARVLRRQGRAWVVTPDERHLPTTAVRVVRKRARPARVPADAKWLHFDLSQQTVTAYRGDRPVYASLISSGKPPHDTPTGLYRIYAKHLSVTMRGPDPEKGWYYIEEVPWTMFYYRKYAIHGAYWHDKFGNTKSHGCTNLAPVDARWLFRFTAPRLPKGWHARLNQRGTWVSFTR
jgi:hypothetical protein